MSITAAEIMSSPVISVTPETGVAEIAELLSSKRISAVPVCKPDGTLAGIVTEADLLRPFRESARQRRNWWLTVIAEGEELSQDFLDYARRDNHAAADLMARHVVTAEEAATLPELAEQMIRHGIKRLPIVRKGQVVGIVARSDMVRAIARAPAMLV